MRPEGSRNMSRALVSGWSCRAACWTLPSLVRLLSLLAPPPKSVLPDRVCPVRHRDSASVVACDPQLGLGAKPIWYLSFRGRGVADGFGRIGVGFDRVLVGSVQSRARFYRMWARLDQLYIGHFRQLPPNLIESGPESAKIGLGTTVVRPDVDQHCTGLGPMWVGFNQIIGRVRLNLWPNLGPVVTVPRPTTNGPDTRPVARFHPP